jgi:hypothetical protein
MVYSKSAPVAQRKSKFVLRTGSGVRISPGVPILPSCALCDFEFENWVLIDGVVRNLSKRKFCTTCSPFKMHNTKSLKQKLSSDVYLCPCGETEPHQFPSLRHRFRCKKCFLTYNAIRCKATKDKARLYLGGRCIACGYDKWLSALAFHHLDRTLKDPNWATMRGWSWKRILSELAHCILLCNNCHGANHSGEDVFFDRCQEAVVLFSTNLNRREYDSRETGKA